MATTIRPIGHDDRLSLVDHLDELRRRLIISIAALTVAFAVCLWQSDTLLRIINRPLVNTASAQTDNGQGGLRDTERIQAQLRTALADLGTALGPLASPRTLRSPSDRAHLHQAVAQLNKVARALPKTVPKRRPVTLGVGEPFTTTLTVAGYFAFLLALPIILYQLYAFVMPAFSPTERRLALPLMLMVPFLFISGVVFGYFVVLPPAIKFLQNYNKNSFDILIQAKDYYKFAITALLSLGILFQIPVGILALTKVGIVTPRQLRKNRRYAIVIIAVIAMLLPGTDPVTMLLSMLPLLVLYEASIVLSSMMVRRSEREQADDDGGDDGEPPEAPASDALLVPPDLGD